jgi:hypothetical protein
MFAEKQRCMKEEIASSREAKPTINASFSTTRSKTAFLQHL